MFDITLISEIIQREINKGKSKFVIYPFGANGLNTKKIMEEFFDVSPICIIDNKLSSYNNRIISLGEYTNNDEFVILFTLENQKIHDDLLKGLTGKVNTDQIVDFLLIRKEKELEKKKSSIKKNFSNEQLSDRLRLHNIIPQKDYLKDAPKRNEQYKIDVKVKVRIVHSFFAGWNSISSICEAFLADSNVDTLIIIGQDKDPRLIDQVKARGFRYIEWDEYNAEDDEPDILIVNHVYDQRTYIRNAERYLKFVFAIPQLTFRNTETIESFISLMHGFDRFNPDFYILDTILYDEVEESGICDFNIVKMNSAKFDGIYKAIHRRDYPLRFEKLKNKRVILWAPSHGIRHSNVDDCTFDIYAKTIFNWILDNPDMGLIFRPHTTLISELVWQGYWTANDVKILKQWCNNSDNIIYDDAETYDDSYYVADAVITDAICGITYSSLAINKPVCITFRDKDKPLRFRKELLPVYETAYTQNDIISFMERIQASIDDKSAERSQIYKKIFSELDGKNGQRIKEFIMSKYADMY